LRAAIGARTYPLHGGFEFDGRPISALDEGEIDAPPGTASPRSWCTTTP